MAEFLANIDGSTHAIIIDDQERDEFISAIRGLLTDIDGHLTVDEGIVYEIYEGLR